MSFAFLEALRGEIADGLQHQEARLREVRKTPKQALVRQLIERVEDIPADILRGTTDRLQLFKVATAGEDRNARHQASMAGIEHVVTPLNRAPQRLLPCWRVACSSAERAERLLQPDEEGLRRKEFDAGRRQLDGKREPVDELG